MPIVAQLVGIELGHESDFKPGFYKQYAMLTLLKAIGQELDDHSSTTA